MAANQVDGASNVLVYLPSEREAGGKSASLSTRSICLSELHSFWLRQQPKKSKCPCVCVFVCPSHLLQLYYTSEGLLKDFRRTFEGLPKDFWRTSKGLLKDFWRNSEGLLKDFRLYSLQNLYKTQPQVFKTCYNLWWFLHDKRTAYSDGIKTWDKSSLKVCKKNFLVSSLVWCIGMKKKILYLGRISLDCVEDIDEHQEYCYQQSHSAGDHLKQV